LAARSGCRRWWEAVEINYRSLQMIERDDGQTIAALVCEDLAQMDAVVDLLRAVGPTLVRLGPG
jgi:hypothetical protein